MWIRTSGLTASKVKFINSDKLLGIVLLTRDECVEEFSRWLSHDAVQTRYGSLQPDCLYVVAMDAILGAVAILGVLKGKTGPGVAILGPGLEQIAANFAEALTTAINSGVSIVTMDDLISGRRGSR